MKTANNKKKKKKNSNKGGIKETDEQLFKEGKLSSDNSRKTQKLNAY